ncbi:MAG TPA: agmatinase [Terriglobales bacterium]
MRSNVQPALLGIPFDANSSYLRGPALAPDEIRKALRSDASNSWAENGVDTGSAFSDAGDARLNEGSEFADIEAAVSEILNQSRIPFCLGGDHSITYPIIRAVAKYFPNLTIVHFDAHPDLYAEFEGNRFSHACPFARIMEEKLAKRLIQLGIRTINGHQRLQANRFGVEVIEMKDLPATDRLKNLSGPVYISFDVDALDPAFAPGVSHREPGGMSVREAIAHLHAISGDIVAADLVEYNPSQDVSHVTATVCAKLVKEIIGKLIVGGED